jgi:hypothetical protein
VNVLLKGGADVNAKGRNNWTALLLALQQDRDQVTKRFAFSIEFGSEGRDSGWHDGFNAGRLASAT